jgi:hypothetical protein
VKFHENPSSGSRFITLRTDGQRVGQAGMTKLIVAFRSYAKAHIKDINTLGKQDREFLNFTSGGTRSIH